MRRILSRALSPFFVSEEVSTSLLLHCHLLFPHLSIYFILLVFIFSSSSSSSSHLVFLCDPSQPRASLQGQRRSHRPAAPVVSAGGMEDVSDVRYTCTITFNSLTYVRAYVQTESTA